MFRGIAITGSVIEKALLRTFDSVRSEGKNCGDAIVLVVFTLYLKV